MDARSITELLRLPSRRELTTVLCAALAIAVVCWYFGADVWHSLLLGCAITVAALACLAATSAPEVSSLDWRAGKRASSDGSRSDVVSLSASLRGGWGLVGLTAERQVRHIARRRLALEGLDLASPEHQAAIERRIGSSAYRILTRRSPRRLRMRTLIACLDALDALNHAYYPVPQPRSRTGTRAGSHPAPGRTLER